MTGTDSGSQRSDVGSIGDRGPGAPDTGGGGTGDGGASCGTATGCDTCTPMGACGWCRRSNRCMAGGSMGSTDNSCSGADWNWLPNQCPGFDGGTTNCGTATGCETCTPMGACGWCRRTNRCMTGGSTGSMDGTCMGAADWNFLPSQCPGFDGGTSSGDGSTCSGIPRTCNLTLAGGVRTCTAGSMVTVGCNQGCTPALGSCTGDAVMQICPGSSVATTCAMAAVIAHNDDAPTTAMCTGTGGSLCPVVTFMCPTNGMYTVWTGPYGSTPATCVPAVR